MNKDFYSNILKTWKRALQFFTLILLFLNLHVSAQIIPYQNLNGMIWLKDGRNLKGIIRLDDLYKRAFVTTPDSLAFVFTPSHIDSLHISVPGEDSIHILISGKLEGKTLLASKLCKRDIYNLLERIEVITYHEHEYNARSASMHEVQKHRFQSEFYLQSAYATGWQKISSSKKQWPAMFKGKEDYAKQILASQSLKLTEKESLLGLINEMNKFARR